MKRFTKRHKPKVRWLQDPAFQNVNSVATSVGVVPTTTLSFFNEMSSGWGGDPAGQATLGVLASMLAAQQAQVSPRAQLLQEPGWRVMRIVGDHHIAIKQVIAGPEAQTATPLWAVTMGLCLLERDEADGSFVDEDDWQLGYPTAISALTAAGRGQAMEGMARSWIWRRTWVLQNFLAGSPGPTTVSYSVGDQVGVNDFTPAGPVVYPYGLGFSSTSKYPSALLGAHFDIKRHVTFKRRQEPVWRFHAIDLTGAADSFAQFQMLRSYRTLIAKAGRPWKDER